MSKFQTKNVEANEGTPSKWIKPPAVKIASIVNFSYEVAGTGSEFIKLVHMTDEEIPGITHEYGSGQIAETRLYLTEKAFGYTRDKLVLIAEKLGIKEKLDAATDAMTDSTTNKEFVEAINPVFKGAKGAFLFAAEQTWIPETDDDGEPTGDFVEWFRPVMNTLGSFVRPENRIAELDERLEQRGRDAYISREAKPASTSSSTQADLDDSDW